MKTKHYILAILVLFSFSSCGYLLERWRFQRPDNEEFLYYTKDKNPEINKNLNTKSFYYYSYGDGAYCYLSFKDDGTVIRFGSTAMMPDTVDSLRYIMFPKRKKNKKPKDLSTDYGFYKTEGDSIFINHYVVGIFGANDWYYLKGIIKDKQILLEGKSESAVNDYSKYIIDKRVFELYQ